MYDDERGTYGDSVREYTTGCTDSCYVDYSKYITPERNDMCEITDAMQKQNECNMNTFYSRCRNKRERTPRLSKTVISRPTDVRIMRESKLEPNGKTSRSSPKDYFGDEVIMNQQHGFELQ